MPEDDEDEVEGEEEAEPKPELTPEEKIAELKAALAEGRMGAKRFEEEYQAVWLPLKLDEEAIDTRKSKSMANLF